MFQAAWQAPEVPHPDGRKRIKILKILKIIL
jgi:hypothetical protein